YYYSRYDYKQAYTLWSEVLKKQPTNLPALFRVAELKMLFEGRPAGRDLILKFLLTESSGLTGDARKSVRDRLNELQRVFLTDRGQSLYLQAVARTRKKDCQSAFGFLNQAAALENGNIRILKEKFRCEKSLGLSDRFYETTHLALDNDPYDTEVVDNM